MSEKIVTIGGGEPIELSIDRDGSKFRAGDHEVEIVSARAGEAELRIDGRPHVVPYIVQGTEVSFAFDGEVWTVDVSDKGSRAKGRHRDTSMSAPMPGIVLKILVKPADVVNKGQPLLILEAMKMEHVVAAPRDGTIEAINCEEGQMVQPGIELITMEGQK